MGSDGRWLGYISRIGGAFKLQMMELGSGTANTYRHHRSRRDLPVTAAIREPDRGPFQKRFSFSGVFLMFKRMILACAVAALAAGCASDVKLDDAQDKSGTVVQGTGTDGAATGRATQSAVTPLDAVPRPTDTMGPPSVPRIVYFDYDSYVVKRESQTLIESHARFLKANGSRKVVVEGHTDERGGREYNLALGQRRAEAVRRALGLLGINDNQVEAVSFGKEKPASPGSDESAWAQNRRAEIVYR